MVPAGTVAALAIKALLKRSGRGGVAEQAALFHRPAEVGVLRTFIARTHGPALFLRVPRKRQLGQFAALRAMKVAARVFAGADAVSRAYLIDIAEFARTSLQRS
jgi:hypothetical protein